MLVIFFISLRRSPTSTLFPYTTLFRSVQGDQLLAAQGVGDVPFDDATCQPLDDGGLADARLADQHGVVLGAAREHLDHAADLGVAPDHRVQAALAGQLGEVDAVLLEALEGA